MAVLRRGAFAGEGPEVIEAVRKAGRVVVEFAGDGGVVAVVFEDGGEKNFAVVVGNAVADDAVDARVAAREDAGARGAADGGDGVGVAEENALFGERVERRCFDGLVANAAHAIGAHLVHHDEEDIGTLRLLGGEGEECAAGEHLLILSERPIR